MRIAAPAVHIRIAAPAVYIRIGAPAVFIRIRAPAVYMVSKAQAHTTGGFEGGEGGKGDKAGAAADPELKCAICLEAACGATPTTLFLNLNPPTNLYLSMNRCSHHDLWPRAVLPWLHPAPFVVRTGGGRHGERALVVLVVVLVVVVVLSLPLLLLIFSSGQQMPNVRRAPHEPRPLLLLLLSTHFLKYIHPCSCC